MEKALNYVSRILIPLQLVPYFSAWVSCKLSHHRDGMLSLTQKQYSGKAEGDARPKGGLMTCGTLQRVKRKQPWVHKFEGKLQDLSKMKVWGWGREFTMKGELVIRGNGRGHQQGVPGEPPKDTEFSVTAEDGAWHQTISEPTIYQWPLQGQNASLCTQVPSCEGKAKEQNSCPGQITKQKLMKTSSHVKINLDDTERYSFLRLFILEKER